jgi:putative peptide zinc metalloprotease protein
MAEYLCFNSTIQVYPFDGASQRPMLVCEVPNKETPSRYLLPQELIEFLKRFDGTQDTQKLIQQYLQNNPQFTEEKVLSLINQYCLSKGLLVPAGAEQSTPTYAESRRRGYMYLRLRLISPKVVSVLSTPLSWLFHWRVLFSLLPIFVLSQAYFFIRIMPGYNFSLNSMQGFDFFWVTLLTSLLGLFHEFGHAAALNHYGFRRSEIGWGLYISFPVFYTDLSDSWKIKRGQRAMVDLGGIYFHCISLLIILGLIIWKHNHLLLYCFFFVDIQIATALNPFLRMDGYWLVGDLFGIADLNKRVVRWVEYWAHRMLGISKRTEHPFAGLALKSRRFLYIYVISVMAFVVLLVKVLLDQVVFQLIPAYPKLVIAFWTMLTTSPGSVLALLDLGSGILWKGLIIYGLLRLIYNNLVAFSVWVIRTQRTVRAGA